MFQLIKCSGTNVQVTNEINNISYLTKSGGNFIYQHADKMDMNENWQFLKCWKTGILTELCATNCALFLTTYAGIFYSSS